MSFLLQDYVAQRASVRPDAIAIVDGQSTVTYAEVDRRSNQLARMLQESGCERGDRVCLLMPKSIPAIVAILAIYKADCIYVPLDPGSPASRLAKMIASAEPRLLLAAAPVSPLLNELFDHGVCDAVTIGWLGAEPPQSARFCTHFCASNVDAISSVPLPRANADTDAAHILFTSGSTGAPKGVVITHRNVIAFVNWAVRYFGIVETDRNSAHPPLHFDLSMFDLFGTFAAGATLVLVPPDVTLLPNKTADFIRRQQLTQWFSVPSVLTYLANLGAVRPNDFPSLKRVLWCGEVLATSTLMQWMRLLPHVTFTNLYGPTEATIASSYYTVREAPKSELEAIPIGFPCHGERLHVLDSELSPVAAGIVGDLYISGVGLSPGYWRNPEATKAAFVEKEERLYRTGDLAAVGARGEVYFRGRADSQIKSRGHRVELGEIEAALDSLQELDDCAVVAIPSMHFDGQSICCAYVAAPGYFVTPASIRKKLAAKLPYYMLPSDWMAFAELPKNANGKVDRPLLKTKFEQRAGDASRDRNRRSATL